jgi:hypothetical protein
VRREGYTNALHGGTHPLLLRIVTVHSPVPCAVLFTQSARHPLLSTTIKERSKRKSHADQPKEQSERVRFFFVFDLAFRRGRGHGLRGVSRVRDRYSSWRGGECMCVRLPVRGCLRSCSRFRCRRKDRNGGVVIIFLLSKQKTPILFI